MARTCIDLISKYLENEFDVLGKENKYNLANRYGPKKCPDLKQQRSGIDHIYSWAHYAPQSWFEEQRKHEAAIEDAKNNKGAAPLFKLCSYCSAPESTNLKHKNCSACKQVRYCATDCQRMHWRKGHKDECKTLQAKAKAK